MKKLLSIFLFAFVIVCLPCLAQDSIVTNGPPIINEASGSFFQWILANHIAVFTTLIAVYELIARLFPTIKNYSIVSAIIIIIQKFIPNKSVEGKDFK